MRDQKLQRGWPETLIGRGGEARAAAAAAAAAAAMMTVTGRGRSCGGLAPMLTDGGSCNASWWQAVACCMLRLLTCCWRRGLKSRVRVR